MMMMMISSPLYVNLQKELLCKEHSCKFTETFHNTENSLMESEMSTEIPLAP